MSYIVKKNLPFTRDQNCSCLFLGFLPLLSFGVSLMWPLEELEFWISLIFYRTYRFSIYRCKKSFQLSKFSHLTFGWKINRWISQNIKRFLWGSVQGLRSISFMLAAGSGAIWRVVEFTVQTRVFICEWLTDSINLGTSIVEIQDKQTSSMLCWSWNVSRAAKVCVCVWSVGKAEEA